MKERLNRSRVHRIFGGVAGGLAEYLNLDPIIVRILFIIITLINGFGIFLYIILWIIIPEENFNYPSGDPSSTKSKSASEPGSENSADRKEEKSNPFDPVEFYNQKAVRKSNTGRILAGIVLIAFGFIFLAERYFSYFDFEDFLPLILIAAGIVLLWNSSKKNK
jgi:phage shock protein PspC (stress-responsive transcriptional regulator)